MADGFCDIVVGVPLVNDDDRSALRVQYTLTAECLAAALRPVYAEQRRAKTLRVLKIAVVFAVAAAFLYASTGPRHAFFVLASAAAAWQTGTAVWMNIRWKANLLKLCREQLRDYIGMALPTELRIGPGGVRKVNRMSDHSLAWEAIRRVERSASGILLYMSARQVIAVPREAFADEESFAQFHAATEALHARSARA